MTSQGDYKWKLGQPMVMDGKHYFLGYKKFDDETSSQLGDRYHQPNKENFSLQYKGYDCYSDFRQIIFVQYLTTMRRTYMI